MAVEPAPIILTSPDLTIGTSPGKSLKCLMSHIELVPDVTIVEVKTGCGIKEYPGAVKWTLKATLYHSFDPVGTNKVLNDAVAAKVPIDFTVVADSVAAVSATNPKYTGQLVPQPFTQLAGDVGDASSFDLEWSIVGWLLVPTTVLTFEADAEATEADETVEEPALA